MDFGLDGAAGLIASGTTQYLSEFSGVFLLVGGLVLAFVVIERLVDVFFHRDSME